MPMNHYVPRFVLTNFADDDKNLWIMDKETGCIRRETSPYSAFAENRYNPPEVEKDLSMAEGKASPIIQKIIECARQDKVAGLDLDEKKRLCIFLLVQSLRIPRIRKWEHVEDKGKKVFWTMLSNPIKGDTPVGLEADVVNANLTEHEHPEYIALERMIAMSIDVGRINPEVNTSFVINDEPCLMKGQLVQSGDRVVMPLAKDVVVQLSRPEDSVGRFHMISVELVEGLNKQAYDKAGRFVAGPDQSYLKCLKTIMNRVS